MILGLTGKNTDHSLCCQVSNKNWNIALVRWKRTQLRGYVWNASDISTTFSALHGGKRCWLRCVMQHGGGECVSFITMLFDKFYKKVLLTMWLCRSSQRYLRPHTTDLRQMTQEWKNSSIFYINHTITLQIWCSITQRLKQAESCVS